MGYLMNLAGVFNLNQASYECCHFSPGLTLLSLTLASIQVRRSREFLVSSATWMVIMSSSSLHISVCNFTTHLLYFVRVVTLNVPQRCLQSIEVLLDPFELLLAARVGHRDALIEAVHLDNDNSYQQ